ncbi:MAG TPA: aminotransferase class V-fold PLP-dependent enzyme [Telluria sp.]|nr:aminotransferase class V-fold PLP-dependent enzyme [Telluria sp.]
MLSPAAFDFDALRAREFARLDAQDIAYLDSAGAALYGQSQLTAYAERLACRVYGNPHSAHAPSRASMADIADAKAATLAFFDADPALYEVCLTANTSAALKLVAESYPYSCERALVLSADNHNSVNGMREFARAKGASVLTLPLDAELRLDDAGARMGAIANAHGAGLLAIPAQSNFSGVKHDLGLITSAQGLGYDVLLDAAAVGPGGGISLREHAVEFLVLAYYKLFGLPSGMGALIVKRTVLERLKRPWFAGGTVDFVSVEHERHRQRDGHEGFEDGTPNFLDAGAVVAGFDFLSALPRQQLQQRMAALGSHFLEQAAALRHPNGAPMVTLYGPNDGRGRGAIFAFNLLAPDGATVPFTLVETRAVAAGVAIRGGCFCNPGAAERAFGFSDRAVASCLDRLGAQFSIPAFQACLGAGAPIGALRLSMGLPTNFADIDRAVALIGSFFTSARATP